MEEYKVKGEFKEGKHNIVSTLKIKNNIIYSVEFNKENKKAVKLVKNKVVKDVEEMKSDSIHIKSIKEAIKDYRKVYKDPLKEIIEKIKSYDEGFPKRNIEDEYETCCHEH